MVQLLLGKQRMHELIDTNLTWDDGNIWKGWTYNRETNRYYFDDIGNESIMGLWEDQWAKEVK